MDKAEVKQIAGFLIDVHEGLCEGDEETTMRLATLEKRARECKQQIEERLGVRN